MKVDYHIHPGYSIDAAPREISECCEQAAAVGLQEICFTPHLEVDPHRSHLDGFIRLRGKIMSMTDLNWLDYYFYDIEKAQKDYIDKLNIRAGIEIGYEPGQETYIAGIVENYPFDFVLGAVHTIDHIAISSKKESLHYFQGKDAFQVCRDYFSLLREAVDTGLFDSIAHIDIYLRHGIQHFDRKIYEAHEGFIEPVLKKMVQRNMSMEINTSSKRKGLTHFHPSSTVIEKALEEGINMFTIGSDAHDLKDIGHDVNEAINFIKDYDLKLITYQLRHPSEHTAKKQRPGSWTNPPAIP